MFKQFLSGKKDSHWNSYIHCHKGIKWIFKSSQNVGTKSVQLQLTHFYSFLSFCCGDRRDSISSSEKKSHFVSSKYWNKSLSNPISTTYNMLPDKFLQEGKEINFLTYCSDGQPNWFGKPHATTFSWMPQGHRSWLTAEGRVDQPQLLLASTSSNHVVTAALCAAAVAAFHGRRTGTAAKGLQRWESQCWGQRGGRSC